MRNALSRLFAFLALLIAPIPALNAALIVDWGGNYVSANRSYGNPSAGGVFTSNSADKFGGFSGGDPLQLNPSINYSGTSGTFYGQISRTAGTGVFTSSGGAASGTTVSNNANADRLEIKLDGTGNAAAGVFLWKKADFLNGQNSGTLNFAAGSTVSTTIDTFSGGMTGRAVLKAGGNYYISSAIFSSVTSSQFDLTTLNWFHYDPAASLTTIGSTATLVVGGVIGNVTEVGFFTGVSGVTPNAVRVSSLEFNYVAGAVIPEPSTFAFVSGLLILGMCAQRRRRH